MALGGVEEFISKAVVQIDGDDRQYLKAVERMRRADAKAAKEREDAIAKELALKGKLTQENFKAALAQKEQNKLLTQGLEIAGQRVKAMGMSLLSGLGSGLIGGILGGSVQSIVQKVFAPPSDADLTRMARYGKEVNVLGQNVADVAREEQARRRQAETTKKGLADADQAVEAVTHANAKRALAAATEELQDKLLSGEINLKTYDAALKIVRESAGFLTEEQKRLNAILAEQAEFMSSTWGNGDSYARQLTSGLEWLGRTWNKELADQERRVAKAKQNAKDFARIAEAFGKQLDFSDDVRAVDRQTRLQGIGVYDDAGTAGSVFGGNEDELPGGTLAAEMEFHDEQAAKLAAQNEKLADSYMRLGDAVSTTVQAFAESGGSGVKAMRALVAGATSALADLAVSEAKFQFAKAAIPPGNPAAFAAGLALMGAAGFIKGMSSRYGGSGGGGGGGGGYSGAQIHVGQGGQSGGVVHNYYIAYGDTGAMRTERDRLRDHREISGRVSGANGVRDG